MPAFLLFQDEVEMSKLLATYCIDALECPVSRMSCGLQSHEVGKVL